MLLLLLAAGAAAVVVALRWRWLRVRSYWADRGVPHEPPHPILGSLTFLLRRNMVEWMLEKYAKFKPSPYFGMWLFWRPALVVTSPEIARQVLVKDSDVFRDRLATGGTSDPIGALNLFTLNDPLWSSIRKRLTPMFTSYRLKSFEALKKTKSQQLVERIRADLADKKFVDLRETYSCYTTDVIGAAAFGVNGDSVRTGDSPMRTVTRDFMKFNIWRGLAWSSMFFLPELVDVFRFSMFPKDTIKYFRKVYDIIVQDRSEKESKNKNLMDLLLEIKKNAIDEGNDTITDDILIAQAAVFLQAGFDTSGVAMTYLTYELAHNPKIQDRVYKEVLDSYKTKGFNYESVHDMTYLNCCIRETLRKYPILGWLDRIAATDYKIDDKLTIPKGTTIYVNAAGMHYDPDYFLDPYNFDPDRFSPDNEGNIKPFTYMPFGEGPRNCIGLRFGVQSILYALSHIILAFELRPSPGLPHPRDLKVDKFGLLYSPGELLTVEFVPRASA